MTSSYSGRSRLPSAAPPRAALTNASHCAAAKASTAPSGSRELRTRTMRPATATSTQLPPPLALARALCHWSGNRTSPTRGAPFRAERLDNTQYEPLPARRKAGRAGRTLTV